jgi:tetratricopeptide (TPR) repeat protein
MSVTISLHNYLQQITGLMDDNQHDLASQHCRYILQQYPRHLDTYRMLGKSYLEQHRLTEAVDVFQRVLSAEPNDFIARVGLALAYKNESLLPNALWHMERAYEMDPYNSAVREELLELYQAHNGREPDRLGLTRAALARFYCKGELYEQAVAELRQLLEAEPERIDLELLLVEALWHTDQRIEVNERCLRIVEELPYCLVANALLAHIRLQNVSLEEARPYLQRVHELTQLDHATLDRETIVGWAFTYPDSPELPEEVLIEPMSELTQPEKVASEADWVDDIRTETNITYDWLSEAVAQGSAISEEVSSSGIGAVADDAADQQPEPDWFFDQTKDLDPTVVDEDADWLADLDDVRGSEAFVGAEESDFPADIADETEEVAVDEETADAPWLTAEPADAPDWLLSDEEMFEPEEAEPALAGDWSNDLGDDSDEDEDWLDQLDNDQAGMVSGEPPTEFDSELGADWLTIDLPASSEAAPSLSFDDQLAAEEAEPVDSEVEEEALDWLMTGPLKPEEEAWSEDIEADIEEEALDWLMTGSLELEGGGTAEVDAEEEQEMLDWLMTGQLELEDEETADAETEQPVLDQPAAEPDQVQSETGFDLDEEEIPDWLTSGPLGADELPVPEEEAITWDDEEDAWDSESDEVPDWLLSGPLDSDVVGAPATEIEPDWETADLIADDETRADRDSGADDQVEPDEEIERDTGDLFADWDGLDVLARAEESPDVTDRSMLDLPDMDWDADDAGSDALWLVEDEGEQLDSEPLAGIAAADIVDEAVETDLPDWLLYYDAEDEVPESEHTSELEDLENINTSDLTGDVPGQIPDWMMLHDTDLLNQTSEESEPLPETADSAELPNADSGDLPEEVDIQAQLDDWLLTDDETDMEATLQTDELAEIDTDELIGDESLLNLPDWLAQSGTGKLVDSEEREDEALPARFSTDDILLTEDDEEQLPDWMVHSVADNLTDLLVDVEGSAQLPEIDTEELLEDDQEEWIGLLGRLHSDDTSGLVAPALEMEDAVLGDHDELDNDFEDVEELEETTDWLQQLDELAETAESEIESDADQALPDWIEDLATDPDGEDSDDSLLSDFMAEFDLDEDHESADELLDWLQQAESEAEPEEPAPPTPDEPEMAPLATAADVGMADDTLAWSEDEADDDVLDWLSEMEAQAESDISDEVLPDDMEQMVDPEIDPPLALDTDMFDQAVDETVWDDLPDDPADTVAWLDQLASEQEDDLLAELSTTFDDADARNDVIDEAITPMVEMPFDLAEAEATPTDEDELEDALEWLATLSTMPDEDDDEEEAVYEAEMAVQPSVEPEPDELTQLLDKLERQALADLPEDLLLGIPAVDDVALDEAGEPPADPLVDALDWLEQTALAPPADGAIEEEADTLEETVVSDFAADDEEEVDTLEETVVADFAADDEEEVDTLEETVVADFAADDEEEVDTVAETVVSPVAADDEEDIDAAEELTVTDFVADDDQEKVDAPEAEVDALALDELPDDPDELMAWLEKLAARQGAALDELPSVSDDDAAAIAQMPQPVEIEPEETAEASTLPELTALFDDLAAAETAETEPEVGEAEPPDVDLPDDFDEEFPEDPDEAMVWLEELAARQAASLEQPPASELDEVPLTLPEDASAAFDEPDELEELDELEKLDELDELEELDDLDEPEVEERRLPGQTDWLTPFDEPDPAGWLEAEEAASSGSDTYEARLTETEPLSEVEVPPAPEPTIDDLNLDTLVDEIDSTALVLDEEQLAAAREKFSAGNIGQAIDTYQTLVKEGRGLSMLIGDLETAVTGRRQPHLQRVLGDAYMRNGQLQKALDTYRDALDSL